MTFSQPVIDELAQRLQEAEQARTPIGHFSREYPEMTIADAYAVQQAWVDGKLGLGRRTIGHKIGLTSRAMQRAASIMCIAHSRWSGSSPISSAWWKTARLRRSISSSWRTRS